MNKYIWITGSIIVVLIAVIVIGKKMGWIGGESEVKVSVIAVSRQDIIERVSASGKIYPSVEVKMSPDVAGEVTELYVHEGDSVYIGQELARIKPDNYVAALDRSVATLNTAKANCLNAQSQLLQLQAQFDNAKNSYDRNKKLSDQKVISSSDFEQIETQYKSALANFEAAKQSVEASKYNVQSAEATVKQSRDDLSKTIIIAPISGIVSKLNIEKGERVVGTYQMAGTEMMRIADLYGMETRVDVSENDVLRVSIGDTAEIEVDAYPDKKFYGVVSEIANSANSVIGGNTDQVTNFTVKILVNKDSYTHLINTQAKKFPLLPGMSCAVEIHTRSAINVIAVPIQSVTTRTDTSKKKTNGTSLTSSKKETLNEVVFVFQKDGTVKSVNVKTGIQDDNYIEITEGLDEKMEVVDGPYSAISRQLKDKMKVKKVERDELFTDKESK